MEPLILVQLKERHACVLPVNLEAVSNCAAWAMERRSYQNTLPEAIYAPNTAQLEHPANVEKNPANTLFGSDEFHSRVCLSFSQGAVFGFCNPNHEHNLVVGSDDIFVDPLGFRIDWTAPLIVHLQWSPVIALAVSVDHIIIW